MSLFHSTLLDDTPIDPASTISTSLGISVVALHCSGADSGQWCLLRELIDPVFTLTTPNLIGAAPEDIWRGDHAFTLADEARPVIAAIDASEGPVHLIGHSYGGSVAMKAASERPDRVASLTLYEPALFNILRQLGSRADMELIEIECLAATVSAGILSGTYQAAASVFIDYWSGPGTWNTMRQNIRDRVVRWLFKAPLEFRAALHDDTKLTRYNEISCPVLIMRGAYTHSPIRVIAEELSKHMPYATVEILSGAGHMGPITHAQLVANRFLDHIRSAARIRSPR